MIFFTSVVLDWSKTKKKSYVYFLSVGTGEPSIIVAQVFMGLSALLGFLGFFTFIITVIGFKKNNGMKIAANFTPLLFSLAGLLQLSATFEIS